MSQTEMRSEKKLQPTPDGADICNWRFGSGVAEELGGVA